MYDKIVKEVQVYVTKLFEKNSNRTLVFHNLNHTQYVVDKTKEISDHSHLNERQKAVLLIAAWFHDTGYLFPDYDEHEQRSVRIMREFMININNDSKLTNEIEQCILATRMPRNPNNLLEEIICDADTYHFGTEDFLNTNKRFMEETKLNSVSFDKQLFDKQTINMLEDHKYYTAYCKNLLSEGRVNNIQFMKSSID